MKKYLIALSIMLSISSYSIRAAATANRATVSVDDEMIQWGEAPFSKCTTIQQKMKCVLSQQSCKMLDEEKQALIALKRTQNRSDTDYTLPLLSEEDTQITPRKTAVFLQLVKAKAVDLQ